MGKHADFRVKVDALIAAARMVERELAHMGVGSNEYVVATNAVKLAEKYLFSHVDELARQIEQKDRDIAALRQCKPQPNAINYLPFTLVDVGKYQLEVLFNGAWRATKYLFQKPDTFTFVVESPDLPVYIGVEAAHLRFVKPSPKTIELIANVYQCSTTIYGTLSEPINAAARPPMPPGTTQIVSNQKVIFTVAE